MKAAVFYGAHQPLVIEEIDVAEPIGREVLVRTTASGVCHSDLHYVDGTATLPGATVLGHEATGSSRRSGRRRGTSRRATGSSRVRRSSAASASRASRGTRRAATTAPGAAGRRARA